MNLAYNYLKLRPAAVAVGLFLLIKDLHNVLLGVELYRADYANNTKH